MVIDAHAHISETEYGNIDLLLSRMDETGVKKTVVVPGGTVDVREMTLYVTGEKKPLLKDIPNYVVYEAIQRYPDRLVGFFGLNPLEEDEAYRILEVSIKLGCQGVKLNPIAHRFSFSGRVLDHVAEECGARGMPIYSHVLFSPGANTLKFGEFARRHPKTNFILGHMGFGSCDAHAFRLAKELPNFFLETSLGAYLAISEAIRIAGDEKLLFGSEFPLSTPKIQKFQIEQLSSSAQERILYRNALDIIPGLRLVNRNVQSLFKS